MHKVSFRSLSVGPRACSQFKLVNLIKWVFIARLLESTTKPFSFFITSVIFPAPRWIHLKSNITWLKYTHKWHLQIWTTLMPSTHSTPWSNVSPFLLMSGGWTHGSSRDVSTASPSARGNMMVKIKSKITLIRESLRPVFCLINQKCKKNEIINHIHNSFRFPNSASLGLHLYSFLQFTFWELF